MTQPPGRFYVYYLVDPRDGKPFYVGKGQRTRGNDHVKNIATHAKDSQHPKDQRIREIIGAGLDVEVKIVERFKLEADALAFEREQIASTEGLTNILSGYTSAKALAEKLTADNTPPQPPQRGRPSTYSEAAAEAICDEIANGASLVSLCQREGMPKYRTVMQWLAKHQDFAQRYTYAREAQADFLAEEILEIAAIEEDVQRARLMVDSRKWYAGKLRPSKYGDKLHQEVTGRDGKDLVPEQLSDLDLARRIAFVLSKAGAE